jgi:cobalt-zinc-cadmium efflux system membrane fusion protein
VQVEEAGDASIVSVPHPEQFKLVEASERQVHGELQAPGVVSPDVSRTVPVTSLVSGRVVELHARLGDTVKQGQILLTIQSPDLSQARADLRKFEADADLARKALDRATILSEHEALAAKDLEAAVSANAKATADLSAAHERFELLGGTAQQTGASMVSLRAPVSGVIIEQNVTGSAGVKSLDNSPNLFTIADLSWVWVLCDINENHLGEVHMRDSATVLLNADPSHPLRARVANISRVLDPITRSAKVRLELANPDGVLRPGMFATATFIEQQTHTVTIIPSSAIVRLHDKVWVFTPRGDQRFQRTEIRAGRDRQGMQEVIAGLRPGERVVANALQLTSAGDQQ